MCIYQPAFIANFDQLTLAYTASIRGSSILKFYLDNLIQIAYRKVRVILLLNFIKFTSIRQKILRQLSLLFVIFSLVKIRLVRKYLKGPEVQNIINGLWTVLGWRLLKIKVNYFVLYILLYLCFRLRIWCWNQILT